MRKYAWKRMRVKERDWMILLRTRRFFPEWGWQSPNLRARHEVERLQNNRTTRTPPRFFSRITLFPRNETRRDNAMYKNEKFRKRDGDPSGFEASELSQRDVELASFFAPETCSISHVLHRRVIFIFLLSLARHVFIGSSWLKNLLARDFYQLNFNLMKRNDSS